MKNYQLIVAILASIILGNKVYSQSPCKEVVGYYPNWQWYDRSNLVNPQTVDYSKYTILNYCFMAPQPDGSINLTDSWADENLLLGQHDWSQGNNTYFPNTSVIDLAHNAGVKVLPSIGGWTLSDNFPGIAADPVKRQTFAQACVNLIQTYNFDGIDLDWEYPGYAPHGGTPQDMANFTLLLQEVRTAIDNYGNSIGQTMLLTAAVGANEDRMDDVDWPNVSQLLDIINLMSYDFFGAWDANANHNAPLYAPAQGDPTFNVDNAVDKLVNFYNVNPNKITVGVGFYGRSAKTTGTPALFAPLNGQVDNSTFSLDDGSPTYYNIMANSSLFTTNWDATAQVPYMTGNGSLNTFVSYDDEQSIGIKAQYIVDNNLRGAIIWEITGDYMETSPGSGVIAGTPLADTLNNVFCNYTGGSAPSVSITGNITICSGESTTLTASGASTYSWDTGDNTPSITVNPTTTTTYTVTGSNSNGTDVETITVTVNTSPGTPVITNSGGTLDAGISGMTYQWYLNGSPITGATSQTYSPTQTGDYTVEITNTAGCSSTSAIYTFGAAPTVSITGNISICEGESTTITANGADSYSWNTGETTGSISVSPSSTTTYTVTGTNSFGTDTETVTVTVNPLPSTPVITENIGVLSTQVTGVSYQWYLDGNIISGATSSTYTYSSIGDYTVVVTTPEGCSATSAIYNVNSIGISEHSVEFRLYPNPANEFIIINASMQDNYSVAVFDLMGKRVMNYLFQQSKTLDVSNLSSGSYLITITNSKGVNHEELFIKL